MNAALNACGPCGWSKAMVELQKHTPTKVQGLHPAVPIAVPMAMAWLSASHAVLHFAHPPGPDFEGLSRAKDNSVAAPYRHKSRTVLAPELACSSHVVDSNNTRMRKAVQAHVIIATKGRADQVCGLLDWLSMQTMQPTSVVVVGVTQADVEGVADTPYAREGHVQLLLTGEAGLCLQRNAGIEHLLDSALRAPGHSFFITFFDDDFRPAFDWLEKCRDTFVENDGVAALTGHVLADGAHGSSLTDDDAVAYIDGKRMPDKHWASGAQERSLASMYGCNMAFRDSVILECRFDENLPLYGWQEDQDYTTQARRFGRTIYTPACRGVHLGTKTGRVSGLRFGYSQIANPLYLMRKGTMGVRKSARFVLRHLIANTTQGVRTHPLVDYRGRLRGNLMAIVDCLRGRCDPRRVLDLR